MSVIIALDGVMRNEHGDKINEGLSIYRAFAATHRVIIATDSNQQEAEHWCRVNAVVGYAELLDNSVAHPTTPLRVRQVELARAHGSRVEFVIDGSIDLAVELLAVGVPVLVLATPKPAKAEFVIRKWSDITTELERQKEIVAGILPKLEHWE